MTPAVRRRRPSLRPARPARPARPDSLGLAPRLFLSELLVVVTGAVTLLAVAVLVAPALFHEHLRRAHLPQLDADVRDHVDAAFDQALLLSMAAAVATAGVAAAAVSWLVARRLATPVHEVAEAAQRLADGHYDVGVPDPRLGPEFASVAASMDRLAHRLAAAEADRRRLTADLAHQLRTPLASVHATVEAFRDGVLAPDQETLAVLADQTERLRRLIADLEKVSRAEERQIVLAPVPQAPGPLVERSAAAVRELYRAKDVDLSVDVDQAAPPVRVDPGRLGEALGNLLDNALRHTPPGGRVDVLVRRRTSPAGTSVDLTVRDTGEGFEPESAERLFRRFYRGPDRAADLHGGSGLGLTIARAIAEAHGGALTAGSDGPGRGARFTLSLPAHPG